MRYSSVRPRLDPILPTVEKPGRYVGLERNVVRKDLGASAVTVALAFPDTYEIGMSHTGLKILYEIVNRRPEFACERTYAPWVDLESRMRDREIPLFTVESFAPVADFDVVGFSLQSELNYSNIPNMLDLAGIPLWQRDRGDADSIVLGGGPCTANPEPLADFFDAFYVPSLYDVTYDEAGRVLAITRNDSRAPERARRTWVPVLKPEYYPDRPMVPSV